MNTKKKMIAVITLIFFICALLLGANTVFSLSDIDINYYLVSERTEDLAKDFQQQLNEKYIGKNVLFIDEEEVMAVYDATPYLIVKECKINYPSTIELTVEERMEVLAISSVYNGTEQYFMSDIQGNILARNAVNKNYADGGENFVVNGLKYDVMNGFTTDKNYGMVLSACQTADKVLGGIRTGLRSLTIYAPTSNDFDMEFVIKTVEGVTIRIARPSEMIERKIEEGLQFYCDQLSDENKLFGTVYVVEDATDHETLRISYTA